MGQLTTHVLDTHGGRPAAGMRIELRTGDAPGTVLATATTLANGRTAQPLLAGEALRGGRYALCFHVGDYFRAQHLVLPDPAFLEQIIVQIGIADAGQDYHVPLLVTPWSYSVYRGG